MEGKLKIALTFSGGGYRAATFHLGTLSYLHSVKTPLSTLLDHVVALSTVSGGTITGLRYMLGLSRGESVETIFGDLYAFLTSVELAKIAMDHLSVYDEGRCASLIRTMAQVYDRELFKGAVLGHLMNKLDDIHVCHFSANATDFTNGLPFRFQVTEKTGASQARQTGYGLIGNYKISIPRRVARHIRLSEVLACSSCFPSGFEPLVFPDDFVLGDSEEVEAFVAKTVPFGIMDGGIVDNQGIEPILLAEKRMAKCVTDSNGKCFDLIIVSDVASPYMKAYEPSELCLSGKLAQLSLKKLHAILWTMGVIATGVVVASFVWTGFSFWSGILVTVWTLITGILVLHTVVKRRLVSFLKASVAKESIRSVMSLRFGDAATLLVNRVKSVLILVSSVFMKHLRRLDYRSIYEDEAWENRCIMNGVYELRPGEAWTRMTPATLPVYLKPGEKIRKNSEKAADMGTTLWFTEEDKTAGIPDALIAAGQYNICWNLLKYIERLKKDPSNTNERHQTLLACEKQLREDWEKFQENPFWRLNVWD